MNQVIHTGTCTLMNWLSHRSADVGDIDFERVLGDMIAEMDKDDDSRDARGKRKGTRTYKCDGQLVFVMQADSFKHRGPHFIDYSPLEFVAIVDILLPKKPAAPSATGAGRPRRSGLSLAITHPLSPYGFLATFVSIFDTNVW